MISSFGCSNVVIHPGIRIQLVIPIKHESCAVESIPARFGSEALYATGSAPELCLNRGGCYFELVQSVDGGGIFIESGTQLSMHNARAIKKDFGTKILSAR